MDSIRRHTVTSAVRALSFIIVCLCNVECDQGLAPQSVSQQILPYGINGVMYCKNWPPRDSVLDLRLVAFRNVPTQNIVNEVQQGRAEFTQSLQPYAADSIAYTLILSTLQPGILEYVAVGQRYGPDIMKDWRVVGIYHSGRDTTNPGTVQVPPDSVVPGINVLVDFLHLPPQP
ncbi:MAG: hypothetical protein HYR76_11245 [Ignavibacteria bacterium]|nr:hypothetical protein [Ignavibacteria bacterium]